MSLNIGLIYQEGPIARSYLEVLNFKKIKISKLYCLNKNWFLTGNIKSRIKFYTINSFAIKFLSNKNNLLFLKNLQEYFNLSENFFQNIYLEKIMKISMYDYDFVGTSLNTEKFIKTLKKDNNRILLNSSNLIFKNVLKYKKNILHIHPGYLPEIRGADASLWSILKLNCYSSTAFYINNNIDEGKILYREKFPIKKFKLFKIYNASDLNKIWFSFIDPAIRSSNLINLIDKKKILSEPDINNVDGKYYSFMDDKKKNSILKEILL